MQLALVKNERLSVVGTLFLNLQMFSKFRDVALHTSWLSTSLIL